VSLYNSRVMKLQ